MEEALITMQAKATRFTDKREAHGGEALKLAGLGEVKSHITPTTRRLSDIHRLVARALDLTERRD